MGDRRIHLASNTDIRSLTEREIERLEVALGKPVDRGHLVLWISSSISSATLPTQPTARERRDGLVRLARQGRRWLQQIDVCPSASQLGQSAKIDELRAAVARFCDRVDSVAEEVGRSIKPGHPRTPLALEAFLHNMIGIAKKAKVLPSTPTRYLATKRLPPAFFNFVLEALAIARDVIASSPLPDHQQRPALSNLHVHSNDALIKFVEGLRGRIGDYHESSHGLVEWDSKRSKDRRRRLKQ